MPVADVYGCQVDNIDPLAYRSARYMRSSLGVLIGLNMANIIYNFKVVLVMYLGSYRNWLFESTQMQQY